MIHVQIFIRKNALRDTFLEDIVSIILLLTASRPRWFTINKVQNKKNFTVCYFSVLTGLITRDIVSTYLVSIFQQVYLDVFPLIFPSGCCFVWTLTYALLSSISLVRSVICIPFNGPFRSTEDILPCANFPLTGPEGISVLKRITVTAICLFSPFLPWYIYLP